MIMQVLSFEENMRGLISKMNSNVFEIPINKSQIPNKFKYQMTETPNTTKKPSPWSL
jgi:hypothetical protein